MCAWVCVPRAPQGPGPALFLCSLFTACKEFCTQVWEQPAVPTQGTDLSRLLSLFLPSNSPLLGIPQVEMKLQNIERLLMLREEDESHQKGQQVAIPKTVHSQKLKSFRGRGGVVLALFLAIFLNHLQLATANATGLMDLWLDFIASWYFYSLKDTLALKTHP